MAGQKYDMAKPRMDLIDPDFELSLARVLTFGANKYGANNWQDLEDAEHRYMAACMRHLNRMRRGEWYDRDSGHPHVIHAACNLMFLFHKHQQDGEPYETTNVQRHESPNDTKDGKSSLTDRSSHETDTDRELRRLRASIEGIIEILNSSRTYESVGAHISNARVDWGIPQSVGAVNSTQDE